MSNLIDEVKRLKELEAKADAPPWKYQKGKAGWTNDTVEDSKKGIMWWGNIADDAAIHLAVDLRNAAPALLEALSLIQPGDDRKLDVCIETLEQTSLRDEFIEPLRRLQELCGKMEAEDNDR